MIWEGMDEVNLEEVFLSRTPMLQSWLYGRGTAKLVGDVVAEERVWKLFGLIPVMLFHYPKVAEVSGNRSWQNEPTSLAEGI